MADDIRPEPFSFKFRIPSPTKKPSSTASLPDEMLFAIAHVALTWGSFERMCDDMLAALVAANNTPLPPSWATLAFRRRRERLAIESDLLFQGRPAIKSYMSAILRDSADIYIKRNVLVHGRMWIRVDTGEVVDARIPGTITLCCFGQYKGRPIRIDFTAAALDELVDDVSHLLGRMSVLTQNHDALAGC